MSACLMEADHAVTAQPVPSEECHKFIRHIATRYLPDKPDFTPTASALTCTVLTATRYNRDPIHLTVDALVVVIPHRREHMKQAVFLGDSLETIIQFPPDARREAGYQINKVQDGFMPSDWKAMPTVGQGVYEKLLRELKQ